MSGDAPAKRPTPLQAPSLEVAWEAIPAETRDALISLPEFERKLLHGLALWLNRYSLRKAADIAGLVNHQTLWQRIVRAGLTEVDRNRVGDQLLDLSATIYHEAGRQTLEMLQSGEISQSQVPIVYGIAADKADKFLRGQQPQSQDAPVTKLLDMLSQGGTFKLSYEREVSQEEREPATIDVESEDA